MFGSIVTVSLLCIVTKSNMEKRRCLRQKCGVEFTPTKPKQKYCSTKCRTYAHRESLKDEEEKVEEPKREVKEDKPKNNPVPPKNDPKEGSMAFFSKYGVSTYAELKINQQNS